MGMCAFLLLVGRCCCCCTAHKLRGSTVDMSLKAAAGCYMGKAQAAACLFMCLAAVLSKVILQGDVAMASTTRHRGAPACNRKDTLLLSCLLLMLRRLASKKPFLKGLLLAEGCLAAAGLLLVEGVQLGSSFPELSVTAAVRSSPSCRPAVPMMLSASFAAYNWSDRLSKGGGASAACKAFQISNRSPSALP